MRPPRALRSVALLPLLLALAPACGATDTPPEASTGGARGTPGPGDPCGLASGFEGDDYCLVPPEETAGIQLHVGPTDYDDPDAIEPYLLAAGEENVVCFNTLPARGDFYYLHQQNTMRSGSHHMIIRMLDAAGAAEGPATCEGALGGSRGGIPGSQVPRREFPEGELAPEDAGLGRYLPADVMVQFELHYVSTGKERLREAWVNLYEKDRAEVTTPLRGLAYIGGISMNVPARTRQLVQGSCGVTADNRVYELFGHMHAHTERFSAWVKHQDGARDLVYESYNWSEPRTLVYDTVAQNGAPDPVGRVDGGPSGQLTVKVGDTFEWECDVNNTTDEPLRFANEAYTAEMCILFGSRIGAADASMFCVRP